MSHRSRRRPLRRAVVTAVAACLAIAATPSVAGATLRGWSLQIEDGVPGRSALPDSISVSQVVDDIADIGATRPAASVYRDGKPIALAAAWTGTRLADLQEGDEIVVVDTQQLGGPWPELARWTYHRGLTFGPSACAGSSTFAGNRTPGSELFWGFSVTWVPAPPPGNTPGYPSYPGYPGYPPYPGGNDDWSWATYPGGTPGFKPVDGAWAKLATLGNDAYTFDATRPLKLGSTVLVAESFQVQPKLWVTSSVEQTVRGCPGSDPSEPEGPQPGTPGPAPTSPPTNPGPVRDTAAPLTSLIGFTPSLLKKLGRAKLIKRGLPITLVTNEAGQLTGTVTLVVGKKRSRLMVISKALKQGTNALRLTWSKSAKKKLKRAKKGKLVVALAIADRAGNVSTPPVTTVKLPK